MSFLVVLNVEKPPLNDKAGSLAAPRYVCS
jgi:hypothetical protein